MDPLNLNKILRLRRLTQFTAVLLAAASLRAGGGTELQQAVFSTRTDLVLAHATVRDSGGQLVKGLTSGDFLITDNGEPVKAPVVMPDTLPLAVGIVLNQELLHYGFGAGQVDAAAEIEAALGPSDVMGLSNVRSKKTMVLARGVDALMGVGPDVGGGGLRTLRSPLDLLAEAAEALTPWAGRRAILFVAGSDEWQGPSAGLGRRSYPGPSVRRDDVEQRLQQLGVLLQVIRYDGGYDTDIDRLAKTAGGTTYRLSVREPLGARANEIIAGLRASYLLGFTPTRLDRKVHKLELRTVRADLKVTGRTEYRATR